MILPLPHPRFRPGCVRNRPMSVVARVNQANKAFSLAEILIYAFVLTTTSAIAFRLVSSFIELWKLRSAAIELSGYLKAARSAAMATNTPCSIDLSQQDSGIFVSPVNPQTNPCQSLSVTLFPSINLGEFVSSPDLKAEVLSGSGSFPLSFTPDGTTNSGVTILLSSKRVSDGVWCVDVQAPLATVRMGWRAKDKTNCNYQIEQ